MFEERAHPEALTSREAWWDRVREYQCRPPEPVRTGLGRPMAIVSQPTHRMRDGQTLQALVHSLARHGDQPAVMAFQKEQLSTWSFVELADCVRRLAAGLVTAGLQRGTPVVLCAPNGPEWMVTCCALLAAAAVPVPVDAQSSDADMRHILRDSEARWIVTTATGATRIQELNGDHRLTCVLLDSDVHDEGSWRHYLADQPGVLPSAAPEDVAVLFYTSGTTGQPKGVPLTHRNLCANLQALLDQGLIHTDDRLLLPLPLHHVYPFTVGLLAPLAIGVSVILPHSLIGAQLVRALQQGQVTAIVGVPRLYDALCTAIETRMQQRGRMVSALFRGTLALSTALRRWLGLRLGQWLFAPLHREFGPHLRVVASGGAALDPDLAWKLEGLGWQIASGYGLTETSPLLTFNPPGGGRIETAGKPLPGVEIRIAEPVPTATHGEILAKGPNVFAGYRRLPEKTADVFTHDGYFRTGDVGYVDAEGYLHVVGRASSLIVLAGGENIWPEKVEDALALSDAVREAGVLEQDGQLVALVVPEPSGQHDGEELDQRMRQAVEQQLDTLPSHHRISDYALTSDPLPRTRLGKLRRPMLAERYRQAKQSGSQAVQERGPLPFEQMTPEDRQLLEDPAARQTWEWLVQRFVDVRLTPDSNMYLDLGVDSLAWLHLTLELRERTGAELDEEAIGRIETVRDLLRETAEAEHGTGAGHDLLQQLQRPDDLLNERQRRALTAPGPLLRTIGGLLYGLDRVLMRWAFRLEVHGIEHLPPQGPFVLTPNHVSVLDPLAVAAALPDHLLHHIYWGGWTGIMFSNPLIRLVSRATGVVPVDPRHGPLSSLAFGVAILQRGHVLVWFPEGERSRDGTLQQFRPGVGLVLGAQPVAVVPVWIAGAYEALPREKWWPRFRPITVTFGDPLDPQKLQLQGENGQPHERIARALHDRVAALGTAGS